VLYEPIGCFDDKQADRALPILVANFRNVIDWNDLSKVVKLCAVATRERGPNAGLTYDKYGPVDDCANYTVGKQWTNFVYELETPLEEVFP
ncbi:hypothetical protein QZH41_020746, partial [Actinostola sp. cb2023]